jgi:hypothetical protein
MSMSLLRRSVLGAVALLAPSLALPTAGHALIYVINQDVGEAAGSAVARCVPVLIVQLRSRIREPPAGVAGAHNTRSSLVYPAANPHGSLTSADAPLIDAEKLLTTETTSLPATSNLPESADIAEATRLVRLVPIAEIDR